VVMCCHSIKKCHSMFKIGTKKIPGRNAMKVTFIKPEL
jgi:hypothetical protein